MASIGQDLKRERELRGITLQQIADSTKISLRFLNALEEDRLDILPGKFITRGIIRTYARSIGLDEDEVLRRFLGSPPGSREGESEDIQDEDTEILIPQATRRTFRSIFIIAFVLAVMIPLTIVLQRRGQENMPLPAPKPETLAPVETRPHIQLPEPKPEYKDLTLHLTFQADTWIQVFSDGEKVLDGLMLRGQETEIKALDEFLIHLGNAGGPSFTINGRPGIPFGESGRVVKDIRITMDNYRDFVRENSSSSEEETLTS